MSLTLYFEWKSLSYFKKWAGSTHLKIPKTTQQRIQNTREIVHPFKKNFFLNSFDTRIESISVVLNLATILGRPVM